MEIFSGLVRKRNEKHLDYKDVPLEGVVFVIPSHNEEGCIADILTDLGSQIPLQQVIVIADNCTDRTGDIAAEHGARVLTRVHETKKSKNYAMEYAFATLQDEQPEIVGVLDADSRVGPGFVDALIGAVRRHNRPAQAQYLMTPSNARVPGQALSSFGVYVINAVRQRGLQALGAPARLTGAGGAFPFDQISSVQIGNAHLADDTTIGLNLAQKGFGPVFVPEAEVISDLPHEENAEVGQRARWETGQVQLIRERALPLLARSFGSREALVMGLDLLIPPLTRLLALLVVYAVLAVGLYAAFGWSAHLLLSTLTLSLFGTALIAAAQDYRKHPQSAPLSGFLEFARFKLMVLRRGKPNGWHRTRRIHDNV
ncbi:MAG: glycosyltransferase family 2 protein [Pseudomonadota bacterium]